MIAREDTALFFAVVFMVIMALATLRALGII